MEEISNGDFGNNKNIYITVYAFLSYWPNFPWMIVLMLKKNVKTLPILDTDRNYKPFQIYLIVTISGNIIAMTECKIKSTINTQIKVPMLRTRKVD